MSFTMEFAASLVRSPKKAMRNRRRSSSQDNDPDKSSPKRVSDFPSVDDLMDEDEIRVLSISPIEDIDAPQDITPIDISSRKKQRKVKMLPTLDEQVHYESLADTSICSGNVTIKSKKKNLTDPKPPTRAYRIKELQEQASETASTGDEEHAYKVYKKAFRIADSEVSRLKGLLNKSLEKHPATLKSIQTRIQEDMVEIVLLAGNIKTKMSILYEYEGDYDNAIECCKEARNIYKRQKKRSPHQVNRKLDFSNLSPGSKCSDTSSDSAESERSIVWYVAIPDIDKRIHEASAMLKRLQEAKNSFEDRKKMVEEILMIRNEIATSFDPKHRRNLYVRVEALAKNALVVERSALGKMHPAVADILQILSVLCLEQQNEKTGYRDKSIQYLLQSLEICRTSLGPKHPRTGQDLLRLARFYQQNPVMGMTMQQCGSVQDEDRAIAYFHQAIDVFKCVKGGHRVVGSILNDLAVIYVGRNDFKRALELLGDSLSSYGDSKDEDEGSISSDESSCNTVRGVCIDVVQVWRNMGECHVNLKDFSKAIECFICALDMQRDARKKHDSVNDTDIDSFEEEKSFLVHLMQMINDESIADTLRRLGKAFAAAARYKEAMVVLREALQIHRNGVRDAQLLTKTEQLRELPHKQDQLANTLYCIAELCVTTGDYGAAVRLFNESMQFRINSDGYRPENQRCNMIHCAMCLVGIANVHTNKKEYVEAQKLYNNALYFCEAQGIPYKHPIVTMIEGKKKDVETRIADDPNRQYDLIRLEHKAEMEKKRGEYNKAIATLTELLTIRQSTAQRLKAAGEDPSREIICVVKLLRSFGDIYSSLGDDERAKQAHKDATRLARQNKTRVTV